MSGSTSTTPAGPPIDPVTFEVIWHRIEDITEEMGIKYMRTSGSPVLVGAYDASTGITMPDGELVAMGPYISTQAHVLRLIISSVIAKRGTAPGIRPGDMFICNDPYLGATHQPDVATVAPVHHDGRLHAWVGSSGHWLDIGGPEPGGFNMNAESVFDEGLRMPPTRIVEDGLVREDLVELIMAQLREPLAELDLRGQIVANQFGTERLLALFDEYGSDMVTGVMSEGISHVERRLRGRLRQLPDGVWREVQYLDHDGHRPNVRQIVCTITKRGDSLTIDFTGSASQTAGFANCAPGGLRAASLSAVCVMLGYDLTWNDGVARCVKIVAPPRTIVSAEYPTPVSMSTISAIIVTLNLVFATLSRMLLSSPEHHEEAMANWCGTSLGVSMTGLNDRGQTTVTPESSHFAAGCGARTYADGVDTGGIIINTTANIPSIEATEAEYPVLYLLRRQLIDSGGAGTFRGGLSAGVALVPYSTGEALETSFSGVGAEVPNGFGLGGGLPGAAVRFVRLQGADVPQRLAEGKPLPAELEMIPGSPVVTSINSSRGAFPVDSVEYHNWQGGGGYGDPLGREPERVLADVVNARVSIDVAAALYGVVLDSRDPVHPTVDLEATRHARDAQRRRRLAVGRPATEIWPADESREWRDLTDWIDSAGTGGVLTVGDAITLDFDADTAACLECGTSLGGAREDPRRSALVEITPTSEAGPVRGQDYDEGTVRLVRYYCPGCGRQFDVSVLYSDLGRHRGFVPSARIAGMVGEETDG